MTRRHVLACGLFVSGAAIALPQTRRYTFHVLGLLHPRKFILLPQPPARLLIKTPRGSQILEGSQSLAITSTDTPTVITGVNGETCDMLLEIPGVIRRKFKGTLVIQNDTQVLVPLLTMDRETAVSSITSAEMPISDALPEALMAQAIVARSFLVAGAPRHMGYDFCDTTHCQFLRSPAAADSTADLAVRQTSGLTLQSQGAIIPCRYSAACGGHTDQREELGFRYQSVDCEGCLLNHYTRRGHGFGLCQEGAMYLSRRGWNYERILALYLPAAHLSPLNN